MLAAALAIPATSAMTLIPVAGGATANRADRLQCGRYREFEVRPRPAATAALLSIKSSGRVTAMGHEAVAQLGRAAVGNAAKAAGHVRAVYEFQSHKNRLPVSGRSCGAANDPQQSLRLLASAP